MIDYIRAETVKIHREHYGILSEKVYDAALLTLCIDDPGAAKAESAGAIKKATQDMSNAPKKTHTGIISHGSCSSRKYTGNHA